MPQGTTLPLIDGRFRLLKLLAVGGMGELYLATARDTEIEGLEHLVVMKRILPAYATNRAVVTMFLTEAHIAARLDHPNVVRVYDMGRAGGSLYFTMEYLHGVDLGKLFDATKRRGAMFPLGHAVTIALGVCDGLHFAHEMCRVDGSPMGVVHRDVSPGNVFITFDGEVKLVDFGIAKVLSSTHHTQAGTRKGKFAYMSPEQVKAGPIDRRTDIFAIGILLYEMVTLSLLFDGDSDYAIMQQIASGTIPPPSTRHAGIAPELERIILKALAHDPDDRYPTALALAEDLARFAWKSDIRVSTVALKQTLRRLIGDAEYPWYLDEEGPEEADAVAHWLASAQPDDEEEEIEDLEISLTDLVLIDDEIEEVDEPPPEAPALPTRVQRPAQLLGANPPRASPPGHPPGSRALLFGAAAAATGIAAVLLAWRCRPEIPPPPSPVVAPPPVAPPLVPVAHPVVRAPEPPPVVAPPETPQKSKKKAKKRRPAKRN